MSLLQNEITGVGGLMSEITGYAQPLRAIGQALETLNIQSFEMEPVGDHFFVRGNIPATSSATYDNLRRTIWGKISSENPGKGTVGNATDLNVDAPVELLYELKDIERLEEQGRSRRINPHGTADPTRLSQVLRCIGAYLNQKRARLLKLSRDAESVLVEYKTSLGTNMKEVLSLSELYDLWVRMYVQRAERAL
jgi:hypothetical protein